MTRWPVRIVTTRRRSARPRWRIEALLLEVAEDAASRSRSRRARDDRRDHRRGAPRAGAGRPRPASRRCRHRAAARCRSPPGARGRRRAGSAARPTSAPASRAASAVPSSDPSLTTTGSRGSPRPPAASLDHGGDVLGLVVRGRDVDEPFRRQGGGRSQSNRSTAERLDEQPDRSLVRVGLDCSAQQQQEEDATAINRTRSAAGWRRAEVERVEHRVEHGHGGEAMATTARAKTSEGSAG